MFNPLRFRVWHPCNNEMLYSEHGELTGGSTDKSWMPYVIDFHCKHPACPGQLILMAGFEHHGTWIYEGDIVTGDRHGTLDEVIFVGGCFCLKNAMMCYEATYWGSEIRVKGNMYETPGLLS